VSHFTEMFVVLHSCCV